MSSKKKSSKSPLHLPKIVPAMVLSTAFVFAACDDDVEVTDSGFIGSDAGVADVAFFVADSGFIGSDAGVADAAFDASFAVADAGFSVADAGFDAGIADAGIEDAGAVVDAGDAGT